MVHISECIDISGLNNITKDLSSELAKQMQEYIHI